MTVRLTIRICVLASVLNLRRPFTSMQSSLDVAGCIVDDIVTGLYTHLLVDARAPAGETRSPGPTTPRWWRSSGWDSRRSTGPPAARR